MCITKWYILYVKKDGKWVPENAATSRKAVKNWSKKYTEKTKIKRVKGRG